MTVPGPAQPAAAGDPAAAVPAIHVAGLRKRYGDVVALADVDLVVRAGEFFTLLGPSGSGKTTLLRLIAGFERPDGGRIELGGRDVTQVPPYASTPKVQAEQAVNYGETPDNKLACGYMNQIQAGSCEEYHANAPQSYFDSISLWKTPIATCDNGQSDCVPYAQWVSAWNTQVK